MYICTGRCDETEIMPSISQSINGANPSRSLSLHIPYAHFLAVFLNISKAKAYYWGQNKLLQHVKARPRYCPLKNPDQQMAYAKINFCFSKNTHTTLKIPRKQKTVISLVPRDNTLTLKDRFKSLSGDTISDLSILNKQSWTTKYM